MNAKKRPLAAILCLMASYPGSRPQSAAAGPTNYNNRIEAFSLTAPPGWTLQDTSYSVWHYTDIFLVARNTQASRITPQDSIRLPEGGVVVLFSHSGYPRSGCMFYVDSMKDSVATLVNQNKEGWQTVNGSPAGRPGQIVERYQLGFAKWNEPWGIYAFARHPTAGGRRALDELLRSMVFHSRPVTLPGQALQLAYEALPAEARHPRDGVDLLQSEVTEKDGTFLVTFHSVDEKALEGQGPSGVPIRSWSFTVLADGTVVGR